MNLRSAIRLLLILFVSSSLTLAQNPDPTGTGNQVSPNLEKSIPPIPIVTGGIALNSSFDTREAALLPVVAPIILVPVGRHALIETEFEAESEVVHTEGSWQPVVLEKGVEYAQLDLFLGKYLTLVAGRYATPFNFYKERLDARWIRNLPEAPLIFGVGDNSGDGGMLRGAVPLSGTTQLTYSAYFSALANNQIAGSERQTGLRTGLFFPKPRFEAACRELCLPLSEIANRPPFCRHLGERRQARLRPDTGADGGETPAPPERHRLSGTVPASKRAPVVFTCCLRVSTDNQAKI